MAVKMPSLDDQKFLKALGNRLRAERIARGLTQVQLGEKCSLDRTFISSIEHGRRNLSLLSLRVLARALRLRLASLLDEL
jgi:transcriptional regulator with XRE-family HTH domain